MEAKLYNKFFRRLLNLNSDNLLSQETAWSRSRFSSDDLSLYSLYYHLSMACMYKYTYLQLLYRHYSLKFVVTYDQIVK